MMRIASEFGFNRGEKMSDAAILFFSLRAVIGMSLVSLVYLVTGYGNIPPTSIIATDGRTTSRRSSIT